MDHAKKNKQVITGSVALNKQLHIKRKPSDIDIWTKRPSYHMDTMEDKLDEHCGCDMFSENVLPIAGKEGKYVYQVVMNAIGGQNVVDYSLLPRGVKTKVIAGVRYEKVEHAKKRLKKVLECPDCRHRWGKTRSDLKRIEAYERRMKK